MFLYKNSFQQEIDGGEAVLAPRWKPEGGPDRRKEGGAAWKSGCGGGGNTGSGGVKK